MAGPSSVVLGVAKLTHERERKIQRWVDYLTFQTRGGGGTTNIWGSGDLGFPGSFHRCGHLETPA